MEIKYYDLTSAQQLLFFSQKYTIRKQVNNVCTSAVLDAELDFNVLRKAVQKAYERNDALRVHIVKLGKEMKQYFAEYEEPNIEYLDFSGKTLEKMEKKLHKIAKKRITVFGKQMSKVYMLRTYDGKCGLYFVVSHMIMDSWAITTFFKDVLSIYNSMVKGTEMPKPINSYEDLLIKELNYRNTASYKRSREFFEKMFTEDEPIYTSINGYEVLEKCRKKKKNLSLRYAFSGLDSLIFTKARNTMLQVPKELVQKMESFCEANKLTMQSLVLLAIRSYFSKINRNEKDISLHTVVARRGSIAEKNAGGTRVHFLPFRTIIEESDTFKEACETISEKQNSIYRHADMDPLEVMGMWKKAYNIPQAGTYLGASITFQPVKLVSPDGINIETKWYSNGTASQPIYFTVMDGDGTGALKMYYEYQTSKVSTDTITRMHSYMLKVLEEGVTKEDITIGDILKLE
ncbi:condensation domain-containing protein [Clostridium swellfunianum]|uniref:condensation domain-containing protein n=1 Tax=Clostridium swellfunianum TaxID=1367462 RepID=UPI00202E67B5|nr:condensation domain-containing protein [Clostridium swellfunianum]MCM0648123.1 condensation domain-containing protein [Clostridium swellfunianum]